MKYKNYKNSYTKEDKIYSKKNIAEMSVREAFSRKNEIMAQYDSIGIPSEGELKSSPNVVWVDSYIREDGTEVSGYWRSKPDGIKSDNFSSGVSTGGASGVNINEKSLQESAPENEKGVNDDSYKTILNQGLDRYFDLPLGTVDKVSRYIKENYVNIDRESEENDVKKLPKNNDEFFEKERNKSTNIFMKINGNKNSTRPDAKLFMDIALVHPKRVPSTQDYQFVSSAKAEEYNKKYNLVGNKRIPAHYDGFIFSEQSPTAKRLNDSEELRTQIFSPKNYDSKTGMFTRDKLEIEFNKESNLAYSFGHMTLLNPKITSDGYVEGIAYDMYNFDEKLYNFNFKNFIINNSAYALQAIKHVKNYFVFVPLHVKI